MPGPIGWSETYSVGVVSIDSQHHLLVSMIRQLQEGMLDSRTGEVVSPLFSAMRQYTRFHFEYEEQLLKEHAYPEFESHHVLHAGLIDKLKELEEKYQAGKLAAGAPLMQFLRTWLLDHIGAHDKAYAAFLRGKGVE